MIEIITKIEPPQELIRIVNQDLADITTVEQILFDAFHLEKDVLAGFRPSNKLITIDLGKCLINTQFMKKGMAYIACAWFNMLWALYHEIAHAIQVEGKPELADLKEPSSELEAEAQEFTGESVVEWAENNKIPTLEEMGWAGEQLRFAVNITYPQRMGRNLLSEIDALNNGGIGLLDTIVAHHPKVSMIEHKSLCELIDKGEQGVIVNGQRYMDAKGFFSID